MVKRAVTVAAAVSGLALPALGVPALAQLSPAATPSAQALADIPPRYLALYRGAARTCRGLPWQVLAAIGAIESDHGRAAAPGVHGPARGAPEGPMQFQPATFAAYAVRADKTERLSPYNPPDAIYTAARMLCAAGAGSGSPDRLAQAVFAYNHAGWYVNDVLALAARYSGPPAPAPAPALTPAPGPTRSVFSPPTAPPAAAIHTS